MRFQDISLPPPGSRSITKAFLLAGGLGTRLKPLTDRVPKCLVPVNGAPMLSIWLGICEELGIREVLINTHHLADQVEAWAARQVTSPIRIHLVHEPELLGSAGTVAANMDFVKDEDDFFVFYADNLVHTDFDALKVFHQSHNSPLTVALFHTPRPWNCGIASLDSHSRITCFEEKPAHPQSDLANAGVYVGRRQLYRFLPRQGFADFATDIFPQLIGEMRGFVISGDVLDVGTPENYEETLREWPLLTGKPVKDKRPTAPKGQL
jgi:mannose-1-phosphate guanylyltransferase